MDWRQAVTQYDPTASYAFDDSANPTKILDWNGTKDQPTEADLQSAYAEYKLANPDPPDWSALLAMSIMSEMYEAIELAALDHPRVKLRLSKLSSVLTSELLHEPEYLKLAIDGVLEEMLAAGTPLENQHRQWWNNVMQMLNFPELCQVDLDSPTG